MCGFRKKNRSFYRRWKELSGYGTVTGIWASNLIFISHSIRFAFFQPSSEPPVNTFIALVVGEKENASSEEKGQQKKMHSRLFYIFTHAHLRTRAASGAIGRVVTFLISLNYILL